MFTSVHNLKEIKFQKKNFDVIFISPFFKTQSHPSYRPLGAVNFINLCTKQSYKPRSRRGDKKITDE